MQMLLALIALLFAIILVATSLFLPPQGEVSESVIYIFAQLLIFSATLLGVDAVVIKKGLRLPIREPTKRK